MNPLQEYFDIEGTPVLIDIEPDEESFSDPYWLKKARYRIGAIIMEFNYLEREIEQGILEIMNDRAEDERIWVFLENMTSMRKFEVFSRLYDIYFNHFDIPNELIEKKKAFFSELDKIRQRRNIYVHANWLNTIGGELVEHRTKKITTGSYGRFREKISIHDLDKDMTRIITLQDELDELHEAILSEISK